MIMLNSLKFAAATVIPALSLVAAPAQARGYHHGHRGGDDAAIAIGAGVVGLALGAALASGDRDYYYDDGYYYPRGYYYRSYPRYYTYYYDYPRYERRGWNGWRGDRHDGWGHRGDWGHHGNGWGHNGWGHNGRH